MRVSNIFGRTIPLNCTDGIYDVMSFNTEDNFDSSLSL